MCQTGLTLNELQSRIKQPLGELAIQRFDPFELRLGLLPYFVQPVKYTQPMNIDDTRRQ